MEGFILDLKRVVLKSLRFERKLTRETVENMTDADMGFRPTPEQMDFGTQALHILSAYATLMGALSGLGWVWDQGMTREKYPTQADILQQLDSETDRLVRFIEELTNERLTQEVQTGWGTQEAVLQLFVDWITHESHHRGQMVTYLRLKGMTPPKY